MSELPVKPESVSKVNTRLNFWEPTADCKLRFADLMTDPDSIWNVLYTFQDELYTLNTAHELINAMNIKASFKMKKPISCGKIHFDASSLTDEVLTNLFLEENLVSSFVLPRPFLDKRAISRLWMHKQGAIIVYHEDSSTLGINNLEAHFYWIGDRPKEFTNVFDKLTPYYADKTTKKNPNIHVLVATPQGYQMQSAGEIHHKFDPDHYKQGVGDLMSDIQNTLKSKKFERGRLWIMHGEPGTGKTYFIRGLISSASHDATFLMIPPEMVLRIGDPNMISVFLSHAANGGGKPLVLILEDADSVLVPRSSDNMAFIQIVLNLTAGILGDALNVAILATTNVNNLSIEEALRRSGRLAGIAEFNKLPMDHAREIYIKAVSERSPELDIEYIAKLASEKINKDMTLSDAFEQVFNRDTNNKDIDSFKFKAPKAKVGF